MIQKFLLTSLSHPWLKGEERKEERGEREKGNQKEEKKDMKSEVFWNLLDRLSKIAKPLTRLTQKAFKFERTEECQKSFNLLKESLTTTPMLATS